MSKFEKVLKAFNEYDEKAIVDAINEELDNGADPKEISDELVHAMEVVGEKFERMELFMPDVMLATDALKAALAVLEPAIASSGIDMEKIGKVVIGTVKGDVHNVGKDMVVGMLTTSGFEVIDLGVDVAPSEFVETAEKENAQIIAASALMTATMPVQKDLIDYLEAKGLRDKYKVMIGGGVVTPEWVEEIGADGYGKDAVEAGKVARKLVGK